MTEKCKFFGARSPEKRDNTKRCRICKQDDPELFRLCILETNKILGTSVTLDKDGNTKTTYEDPGEQMSEQKNEPATIESNDKTVSQPKTVKNTGGVLSVAKSMISEGKTDGEVMIKLIELYIADGKTPKQAKHNAQSCIFNAKRKLAAGK